MLRLDTQTVVFTAEKSPSTRPRSDLSLFLFFFQSLFTRKRCFSETAGVSEAV